VHSLVPLYGVKRRAFAPAELPQLILFDKQFPGAETFPHAKQLIEYAHEKIILCCGSIIG
jgi:hypothetical protein